MEFTFHWGDEIVCLYGYSREEAWATLDTERYHSPHLTIDALIWSGFRNGFMCCLGFDYN